MSIKMGEKIRSLRKSKNISQEVLAQYLGVSFQAVSKWENGATMPDVELIPAIASFFDISTDELFDYNLLEIERRVESICAEAYKFRTSDPARSESILRDGLRQFPGNEVILNNLLYTMRAPERNEEVVALCKTLIECAKFDDVRYDALRILAETYKDMGEYALTKATIERIPEFYFTKLQLDALLLEGEDSYRAAWAQKDISTEIMLDMMVRIADYHQTRGETDKARRQLELAEKLIITLKEDEPPRDGCQLYYEYYGRELLEKIRARLA